ncbi:MAG: DUF3078 domain-containing protein, partial [Saprospiraceae bacterium]|nr:DUF3078 domain-containing protein [Saprospiraceae bacterium]
MRTILTILLVAGMAALANGQSIEELTQQRDAKAAELSQKEAQLADLTGEVANLKAEVDGLTDQITPYPRWTTGAFGNLGLNIANFSDWLSKDAPNTSAVSIGISASAFADMDQEKYFWRNDGSLTLGWIKFDNQDLDTDEDDFQVASDALNLSSLFGYKISAKLAASALAEYRTSVLDGRFNDPGYLDLGVGATWTPLPALSVVIHPLNYNIVFSESDFDYQSSTGAKILATYARKLDNGVSWKSKLSVFASYKDMDTLSNWTWVNTFTTAIKGI